MLRTRLLHPDILQALAMSGHFSKVMIADGNYPFVSRSHPATKRVFLNLAPGLLKTTDVLEVIAEAIPIQAALMMRIPDGQRAPIVDDYRARLPAEVAIDFAERQVFYDEVAAPTTSLLIATGETRRFANLLLTIGVVKLETSETY